MSLDFTTGDNTQHNGGISHATTPKPSGNGSSNVRSQLCLKFCYTAGVPCFLLGISSSIMRGNENEDNIGENCLNCCFFVKCSQPQTDEQGWIIHCFKCVFGSKISLVLIRIYFLPITSWCKYFTFFQIQAAAVSPFGTCIWELSCVTLQTATNLTMPVRRGIQWSRSVAWVLYAKFSLMPPVIFFTSSL